MEYCSYRKDHLNNPSWDCIHCGRRGYGGVALVRKHILDKCSPFAKMQPRHTEAKKIVEEALEKLTTHKQQTLENFSAAHLAKVGPTLMDNWSSRYR